MKSDTIEFIYIVDKQDYFNFIKIMKILEEKTEGNSDNESKLKNKIRSYGTASY